MNKWLVVACCAMSAVSLGASAEVYKWKDSSGKVHYSDTPPTSNVPYGTISGKKTAPAPEAAAQGPAADAAKGAKPGEAPAKAGAPATPPKGETAGAQKGADPAAQKRAQEDQTAKDAEIKRLQEERDAVEKKIKESNCKNARARVAQFEQGGRMYRIDEKGERVYYGDKDIASGLEQAKADVEANCTE